MNTLKNYYNQRIKKDFDPNYEELTKEQKSELKNMVGFSFYQIHEFFTEIKKEIKNMLPFPKKY